MSSAIATGKSAIQASFYTRTFALLSRQHQAAWAAVFPAKTGDQRTGSKQQSRFSEEDLLFLGVNLQHKDSKKVLFPYEMGFFSSSIRIAIGE